MPRFGASRAIQRSKRSSGGGAAVPVLPTFSITPQVVYSQIQAVSGYSGPALRLVKASDSSTLSVPFTSGELDTSGVAAFTAASTTAVDIWYDQSGNAANATQTTASSRPQFMLANAVRGKTPIAMGFRADGAVATNGVVLPSISNNRQSVTILSVLAVSGAGTGGNLYDLGGPSNYFGAISSASAKISIQSTSPGMAPVGPVSDGQLSTVVLRSGVGTNQTKTRVNGVEVAATSSASIALTGGYIGGVPGVGAAGPHNAYFFAVYPGVLSDAEVTSFESWAASRFDILFAPTVGISMDGDSITAGVTSGIYGRNLSFYLQSLLNTRALIANSGVGSQTAAQRYAVAATTFAASYSASRIKNIAVFHAGTNDITQNSLWGFSDAAVANTTATASSGTNILTVASATGIAIGQTVNAVGVTSTTAATYVTAVSGTSITISNNTTAALSGTAVKFGAGTTAAASATASNSLTVASATGFATGTYVRATGVPYGTTVTGIAGNVLTLSGNVTVANGAIVVGIDPALANSLADGIYSASHLPYVQAAIAYGFSGVVLGTTIARNNNTANVGYEIARLRLNANIVAGAAANNYRVADYASAGAITTADGVHPLGTPAGFGVMAPVLAAEINALL